MSPDHMLSDQLPLKSTRKLIARLDTCVPARRGSVHHGNLVNPAARDKP